MKMLSIFSLGCMILFFSLCTPSQTEKNKNEINPIEQKEVSIICLKENDSLFLRINNKTKSFIYVPKEYTGDCTSNDDTLHLETIGKLKYATTLFYKYKNIFPFDFYSTRKIPEIKADTIEQYKKQIYFFNQFRVQQFVSIPPDSFYIVKLVFAVPKYANIVSAVFYNQLFLQDDQLNKVNYSLNDFLRFDSLNARYVISPILIRYH